ncbi:MAG TPA: hypothetical protein VIY48_16875 [Candidatus Paceibacterota bacterium]
MKGYYLDHETLLPMPPEQKIEKKKHNNYSLTLMDYWTIFFLLCCACVIVADMKGLL